MNLPSPHPETGLFKPVWRELNLLRDYVQSLKPTGGAGMRVRWSAMGTTYESTAKAVQEQVPGGLKLYKIKQIFGDYVKAVEWNGSTEGTEALIAKPYLLRTTPFHEQSLPLLNYASPSLTTHSYETTHEIFRYDYLQGNLRRCALGGFAEWQIILPPYEEGATLYASECDYTGVFADANGEPVYDGTGTELTLVEVSARAWARL